MMLPPGHPPIGDGAGIGGEADDEEGEGEDADDSNGDEPSQGRAPSQMNLPPGHPPTTGQRAPGPIPRTAENSAHIDPAIPSGSVTVEVHDALDRPVPNIPVALSILVQTIAKSDSRSQLTATTDDKGEARYHKLPVGATASYRATVSLPVRSGEPATYASPPFQLDLAKGERVRIHVYPTTNEITETLLGIQGMVYIELRDDVLQFHELYRFFNMGQKTWIPSDVVIDLPPGARAIHSERGMTDARFDVEGSSVRLRGTFSPGRHEVELRFQLPYQPGRKVDAVLPMPPHVASATVMAEASKDMKLAVSGFPEAKLDHNQGGQRILITNRQLRAGEQPFARLQVTLDNLPGPGPENRWAAALAACAVLVGLYFALSKKAAPPDQQFTDRLTKQAEQQIVAELAALEKAKDAGSIGPKTYARARQELIDALARLLASHSPVS